MVTKDLKVAIVHDWFVGGGAEKVVAEISKLFPDAPIFTSYCSDEWRAKLAPAKIHTSYLQHLPRLRKFLPPLRQHWFSHLKLEGYDLVISSSGAEAKGLKLPKGTAHVNYCHAPTHYYWSRYDDYIKNPGFGAFNWLARLGLKVLVGPMRKWDYQAAQRPDYIIANSGYIKAQIKKYYGRDSVVISPPVELDRFAGMNTSKRSGFVVAGRQTHYKRFDLAVEACTDIGMSLTVLGKGPDHERLVKIAGPTIKFVKDVSDSQLVDYMKAAEALIFPGLDDFGITAVEAMAAGTPVIAYQDGGALDYIKPGVTGEFFSQPTSESLQTALESFDSSKYQSKAIQEQASQYSPQAFRDKLIKYLESLDFQHN